MDYYGFCPRNSLILDTIPVSNDLKVLEIGVGAGGTANLVVDKVKKFVGVDISQEMIDLLQKRYDNKKHAKFYCIDVCKQESYLREQFDYIYSADTLEHVACPESYFKFIKNSLDANGLAKITFPNESERSHHGVNWFHNKSDLLKLINRAGLKVTVFKEVKKSLWHRMIKFSLWSLPKRILACSNLGPKNNNESNPQTFEETRAFSIIESGGIKADFIAVYAWLVNWLADKFTLYKQSEVTGNKIENKRLLLILEEKEG